MAEHPDGELLELVVLRRELRRAREELEGVRQTLALVEAERNALRASLDDPHGMFGDQMSYRRLHERLVEVRRALNQACRERDEARRALEASIIRFVPTPPPPAAPAAASEPPAVDRFSKLEVE